MLHTSQTVCNLLNARPRNGGRTLNISAAAGVGSRARAGRGHAARVPARAEGYQGSRGRTAKMPFFPFAHISLPPN